MRIDHRNFARFKHAFATQHSGRCGGSVLPAGEAARTAPLFEQDCMSQFSLPGNGVTAASLEDCASATEAAPCQTRSLPECDIRGTLPERAPCFVGTQCESGRCSSPSLAPGRPPTMCGTCDRVAQVGEKCSGNDAVCARGSTCVITTFDQCVAFTFGEDGANCDELTALCRRGLYCEGKSNRCTPLGDLGQPCDSNLPTGCKPPLFCSDASNTCTMPGGIGSRCNNVGGECAPGLGCDQASCAPLVWVAPGELCGLCLGRCHNMGLGEDPFRCRPIVANGAPCAGESDACEDTSTCFDGTCQPVHSIRCE
jgi:hypothetical protein